MKRLFEHLHEAIRQNNEIPVEDFRIQFDVLSTVRFIEQYWNKISKINF